MKKQGMLLALLAAVLVAAFGCGHTAQPESGGSFNFPDPNPNPGDPALSVNVVFNMFATGAFPNDIEIVGNQAYVVNSGSNNIERIDLDTGTITIPFILTGVNPYEITTKDGTAYITNFVSNTVTVADLASGAVLGTITPNAEGDFNDPEGIAIAANGLIFVANADFDPSFNQGPGFVTVIDSATAQVVNQIPTTQKNPQFVTVSGNTVYVVNSGAGTFDSVCFCFKPVTDGGVDIFDATTAATASAPVDNIAIPLDAGFPLRGFPGELAIASGGQFGYTGSNSGNIYKVDLTNHTLLRGNANPILVTPDASDNLIHMKFDSKGDGWVMSFNEDKAYLFNSGTDEIQTPAISVDSDPQTLEGPLTMAFRENGVYPDVYVIMSVSEQITGLITN